MEFPYDACWDVDCQIADGKEDCDGCKIYDRMIAKAEGRSIVELKPCKWCGGSGKMQGDLGHHMVETFPCTHCEEEI